MQLSSGRRFQHSYLAQFTVITRWVEVLCHDINVHIPTTFPRYPSYNLRLAHRSLQQNWGLILMINVGSLGL